jgi:hypothetical protein
LASQQFAERQITPHDYKKRPETAPDLGEALATRIAACDAFICVLNKDYYDDNLTRNELEQATALATGKRSGNLKKQGRFKVYIFCEDAFATEWVSTNHPGFTFMALADYQFRPAGDSFSPVRPELWQQFMTDIKASLDARGAGLDQRRQEAGRSVVVLGRPEGQFDDEVDAARTGLIKAIFPEPAVLADNWHDSLRKPIGISRHAAQLARIPYGDRAGL